MYNVKGLSKQITYRCINGDFYVVLGSSRSLALFVWVGGGLLKRVLYFFGNEPSLGQKSPILHLPHKSVTTFFNRMWRLLTYMAVVCSFVSILSR